MKVNIFIPCFIDQLFPQTAVNMVKVLRKIGCQVEYNPNQTCCGQPAYNAGFVEQAQPVCEKFVNDFAAKELIVTPSASCVGFVRNHYKNIFDKTDLQIKAQQVRNNIIEFSDFLVNYIKIDDFGAQLKGKATYHDACAALRECGIKTPPRQLLAKVKGLELIESEDCEECCGFGGTFATKFEPISVAMADKKIETALALGVDYIISTDLSCLMQLEGCIKHRQLPLKVMHLADVLAAQ